MGENRIAVLALIVEDTEAAQQLNALLHGYRQWIIGRMGLPCRERGISLISVAMDAPSDEIAALSGKLGRLPGVTAKTAYAPVGCGTKRPEEAKNPARRGTDPGQETV